MKCRSKKQEARSSNWQWFLVFLITCFFLSPISYLLSPICLYAEDAEIKLNTSDGSSCFVVQDKNAAVVSSITSVGNAYFKGNVGIGTPSPNHKMQVDGNALLNGQLYSVDTNHLMFVNGDDYGFKNLAASGNVFMHADNGGYISFLTNAEKVRITNIGNVGIGLTGPLGRLHVLSDSTSDKYVLVTSHTVSGYGLVVSTTGNVGIGTTNPETKLHVDGGWVKVGGAGMSADGLQLETKGTFHQIAFNELRFHDWTGGDMVTFNGGNVGIGLTGPEGRLHVLSNSTSDKYVLVTSHTVSGFGLVVSTSGNVGIGTTAPNRKLDVVGNIQASQNVGTEDNYGFRLRGVKDATHRVFYDTTTESDVWEYNAPVQFRYYNAGSPVTRIHIANDGNLGIGLLGPLGRLHVLSDSTSDKYVLVTSHTVSGYGLVVSTSGNIGIGTTGPARKLHVSGGSILLDNNNALQMKDNLGTIRDVALTATDGAVHYYGFQGSELLVGGNGITYIYTGNGAETMTLLNGNVGIGTTGPEGRLHVLSDSTSDKYVLVTSHTVSGYGLVVSTSGNVGIGTVSPARILDISGNPMEIITRASAAAADNRVWRWTNTGSDLRFEAMNDALTGGTNIMTLLRGGNVGIGTPGPGAKLHVIGGDMYTASFKVEGSSYVILNAGNVGIGTTTPTALLDINGSTGYNQLRMRTAYTPTSSADANGNTGDIAWDDNYVYIKTSVGWKRAALTTW